MSEGRSIKRLARQMLRRHYFLLIVMCAVSVFLGTEFTNIADNAQILYDVLTEQVTQLDVPGMEADRTANDRIVDDLIGDSVALDRERAAARMRELKESTDPHSVLGRQRGILAAIMNNLNSGQLTVTLGMALHSIVHSRQVSVIIMILGSAALNALVWIYLRNMYRAILRRAMLELRVYDALPLGHLLHFKMVRRWNRAALTLFMQSALEWLWQLTIVGGVIKHYSYFLVPFIVAENPDVRPREAIRLSRRMMDGHKWACFKLEMSFLGWMLLGFFTFGVTEALWSVPYRMAAFAEYYASLRAEARERGIPGAEQLNDDWLFAPADEDVRRSRYGEILRREDIADEDIIRLSPVRRFMAQNLGIWTASLEEKKVYSRQEGLRQQMRVGRLELEGRAYPQRLNPLWHREAAALTGRVSYLTPCTVWSLIVVFFAFNIIGWLWEVSLHLVTDGEFVNRGIMHGPWLPIYGSGVVLIAVLLYRFRRYPALEALSVILLCGVVEYATSFFMERSHGIRWWDYTGYYLNLNGRICGEGLAVFALGGMAAIYLLVPVIDGAVTRVKPRILIPVCVVLTVCFVGDMIYSRSSPNMGRGITDYGQFEEAAEPTAPEPDGAPSGGVAAVP